jgi:hypothetical protein
MVTGSGGSSLFLLQELGRDSELECMFAHPVILTHLFVCLTILVGPGYSRDVEERIGGERKENDDTDRRKEGGTVIGSDPTIEHCDCLNKKKNQ